MRAFINGPCANEFLRAVALSQPDANSRSSFCGQPENGARLVAQHEQTGSVVSASDSWHATIY
jgi:hypothetical protein